MRPLTIVPADLSRPSPAAPASPPAHGAEKEALAFSRIFNAGAEQPTPRAAAKREQETDRPARSEPAEAGSEDKKDEIASPEAAGIPAFASAPAQDTSGAKLNDPAQRPPLPGDMPALAAKGASGSPARNDALRAAAWPQFAATSLPISQGDEIAAGRAGAQSAESPSPAAAAGSPSGSPGAGGSLAISAPAGGQGPAQMPGIDPSRPIPFTPSAAAPLFQMPGNAETAQTHGARAPQDMPAAALFQDRPVPPAPTSPMATGRPPAREGRGRGDTPPAPQPETIRGASSSFALAATRPQEMGALTPPSDQTPPAFAERLADSAERPASAEALNLPTGPASVPSASTGAPSASSGSPAMAQQAAQQIAAALTKGSDGSTEIALAPKELGRVRLSLSASDGALLVSIMAERGETADLMRRHIDSLAQEFRALGYGSVTFSFGDGGSRAGAETAADEAPAPRPRDATSPEPDTAAAPSSTSRAAPRTGLDLRL